MRSSKNIPARKRQCDLQIKIHIHPTINSEVKRSKIHHINTMVKTMDNTRLDLREYARMHATIHCRPNQKQNLMCNPLVTTILSHYHLSKLLKFFSEPGVSVVLKYIKKLHNKMVMDPKNVDDMSKGQKKTDLQHLMFLNQKTCGKTNGRSCANRRNQRKYLTKDDTRSPTVATVVMLLMCLIDTMVHREVSTVDIPG